MEREFIFRPLDISDCRFLAEYAAECEGISESREISEIERRLKQRFKDTNYVGVIALSGNERIGFQDGVIVNQRMELNEIYVKPEYRRKGVAEQLLNEIISIAKSRGVKRIVYHTEPDNAAMQKLGEKAGFSLKGLIYEKEL
ncbi:MAG: GNAT family N-acetyltransferase [bacterium]|nr:GNAT family N-acetyltransferase [bacterium]